jgi:ABC-type multidrug transport system ATPase subunit
MSDPHQQHQQVLQDILPILNDAKNKAAQRRNPTLDRMVPPSPYTSDMDQSYSDIDSPNEKKNRRGRSRAKLRQGGGVRRKDHLRELVKERRARVLYFNTMIGRKDSKSAIKPPPPGDGGEALEMMERPKPMNLNNRAFSDMTTSDPVELTELQKADVRESSVPMKFVHQKLHEFNEHLGASVTNPIEIRMNCFSYAVPVPAVEGGAPKIRTVYNSSLIYHVVKFFKNLGSTYYHPPKDETATKLILDGISLVLRPGKMYLVLGPPQAGKSSFLRAIAGRLAVDAKSGSYTEGKVSYNGKTFGDNTNFHIENGIAFIDQLDFHAPRLTVEETLEFAYQSKRGGTHINFKHGVVMDTEATREVAAKADMERMLVNTTLALLGLAHVKDTFVGDDVVRGVSGGQRRRVTVGEMLMDWSPVLCGDEISNGLDAASTFDMIQILMHVGRLQKMMRVISLLQPSPETVSLFDEVILLAAGQLVYAGPISDVESYFANLGYHAPLHMDVADFLQMLATPDAVKLYDPPRDESRTRPYTASELAKLFRQSKHGVRILAELNNPHSQVWKSGRDVRHKTEAALIDDKRFQEKYANSFHRSVWLNLNRNLTIWYRDKRPLIANAVKNIIMGISVGGVFFQTDDVVSILGVLFQGMLFIMLGAMTSAPAFVDERAIYYKLADAKFFSAYPFIVGKAVSKLPQVNIAPCVRRARERFLCLPLTNICGRVCGNETDIYGLCCLRHNFVLHGRTDQYSQKLFDLSGNHILLQCAHVRTTIRLFDSVQNQRKRSSHQRMSRVLFHLVWWLHNSAQCHSVLLYLDLLVEPHGLGIPCFACSRVPKFGVYPRRRR